MALTSDRTRSTCLSIANPNHKAFQRAASSEIKGWQKRERSRWSYIEQLLIDSNKIVVVGASVDLFITAHVMPDDRPEGPEALVGHPVETIRLFNRGRAHPLQ
jgi:hypothetical protein